MSNQKDIAVIRELTKQYAEIAADPIQEEKRKLWTDHMSLKPTRPLILATFGMHNVWCREVFNDAILKCEDPFYRQHERGLKMVLFHHREICDDLIAEPWLSLRAAVKGNWGNLWGVVEGSHPSGMEGGAWKYDPPIRDWSDAEKLTMTHHQEDVEETERLVTKLHDAVGDLLPIDVNRGPCYSGFCADISTDLAKLRGLETLMLDMYEYPDELHGLLAFMRDGILKNNQDAEDAGAYSLTCGSNQAMTYADSLEAPKPNSGPRKRQDLWGFCAAQEYTLISPEFHDEFLFQYQREIMKHFGLTHYGCCEDLTEKIDMLRQLENLRSIAVTPTADIVKCAEQIQQDYVISWRPNPTDMVCCGYDEALIKRIISHGLNACCNGYLHIHLKDVETVEGDTSRLGRWVKLVRSLCS